MINHYNISTDDYDTIVSKLIAQFPNEDVCIIKATLDQAINQLYSRGLIGRYIDDPRSND